MIHLHRAQGHHRECTGRLGRKSTRASPAYLRILPLHSGIRPVFPGRNSRRGGNPVQGVLQWCVNNGRLTPEDLASDLARLSGKQLSDIRRSYESAGKWNVKAMATALRPLLFAEKTRMKNDGSVTLEQARQKASKSLVCAALFKHHHTDNYLSTVVRYKRFYDSRGG
jgi:hypothetical protein